MADSLYPPPPPPVGSYIPPSSPPPPPPPSPTPGSSFDFARCLTFVFEDPDWIKKILIGGLMYLAVFVIVGWFFLMGYFARLARNVIEGNPRPLPEWDDLGEYFNEGLKLAGITLIYSLPFVLIACAVMVPAAIAGNMGGRHSQDLAGGLASCVWCLMVPIFLAMALWIPAALLRAIATREFRAAFEFGPIAAFIRANIGNYLLAIVVHLVANFISQFGVVLLCIGIIFTAFWSVCVSAYAFAQTYRLAVVR
jgi:Protein of unknown function (DUF4013)